MRFKEITSDKVFDYLLLGTPVYYYDEYTDTFVNLLSINVRNVICIVNATTWFYIKA